VLGRTVAGSGWFAMAADYKRSSRFTLASQATVTHLAAHLDGHGGAPGSQQLRYALYADHYGQPQTLLAQTAVGTIYAGQAATWLRLPLPNQLTLNPGSYHLALLGGRTGNVARYSRSPATNSLLSLWDTFSDGAANPHGTGTPADYQLAIHALHDQGAAPAPPTDLTQKAASTTSVDVAWTAAAGQVAAGYTVYADGARVGTTSATTYTVTGLACGRTYTIGVETVSAAGNASARASVAATTAACPALAPPPPPAGVTCDRVAAPGGSDSNAGTLTSPYATPQKLADTLASGQTGCLRAGAYSGGNYVLTVARSGFRLRSYPGERARLVGIVYIKNGATNITLSHLDIEGTGAHNTVKVHATDAVIEDNTITNRGLGLSCMILGDNAGWGAAHRTIVRRNTFHDCGATANGNKDHGIYAANIADGQILNNVFWNTASYAIHLYPNTQRTRVAHNVIDGAGPSVRGGIIVAGDARYAASNNTIEYNVVAYAASYNIETYWETSVGSGNVARKNCVWGARLGNILGIGLSLVENLVADPMFVDRSAHDYRLSVLSLCRLVVGDVGP
jgi:hypothetical protein